MTSQQAANAARFWSRQVVQDRERLAHMPPGPLAERVKRGIAESMKTAREFSVKANELAREEEAKDRRRELRK